MKSFREPKYFKQITALYPGEIFQVDIADIHPLVDIGLPLARYFMVCIDVYSRYCKALAMLDRTSLRGKLVSLFRRMTVPKQIVMDEEFGKNNAVKSLLAQNNVKKIVVSPWEKNKNGIVERVIGTLKRLIIKYINMYGVADYTPEDNLQVILDSITDTYNQSTHSTIGARPIEVWLGIDNNHQKIVERKYPKYLVGTYVLKRPDIGTNIFNNRTLNYDPEIYQIVRAQGESYNIKSLFGPETIKGLRYWMFHPITIKDALKILNNKANVNFIVRKITNNYNISMDQALTRIEQVKKNLQDRLQS